MRIKTLLREMCLIPALSGYEQKMAAYMQGHFEKLGYPVEQDALGNCIAKVEGDPSLPTVMVFGHMDQLGFLVRSIEPEGFLRLERLGGIPEKVLPATDVQVQCRDGSMVDGIIGMKAHHITPPEEKYHVEKYSSLFVDIGAKTREEVLALGIDVGQPVVYSPKFRELRNNLVSGTSIDNRVACAMVVEMAYRLKESPVKNTVYLVGTVQEEFNLRGGMVVAQNIKPDIAICIDIAIEGGTPDLKGFNHVFLGKGPAISLFNFHGRGTLNGTIAHPGMVKLLEESAAALNIGLQRYASVGILTDLSYVQFMGKGVKCIDLAIPCRYTHTPAETCCIQDVEQGCDLLQHALGRVHNTPIER